MQPPVATTNLRRAANLGASGSVRRGRGSGTSRDSDSDRWPAEALASGEGCHRRSARWMPLPSLLLLVLLSLLLLLLGPAVAQNPPPPPRPPPRPPPPRPQPPRPPPSPRPPPPPPAFCPSLSGSDPFRIRSGLDAAILEPFSQVLFNTLNQGATLGVSGSQSTTSINVPILMPFFTPGPATPATAGATAIQVDSINLLRYTCVATVRILQAECTWADSQALAAQGILASGSNRLDHQCRDGALGGASYNYWDSHAVYREVASLPVNSLAIQSYVGVYANQGRGYFVYTAQNLSQDSFYKWKAQLIDIDGRLGALTNCTNSIITNANVSCAYSQTPQRPLATVQVPKLPNLVQGVISAPLTITIVPPLGNRDWTSGELLITPTVTNGLFTFVPSSVPFSRAGGKSGDTTPLNGTFRALTFTVGAASTVQYVVSSAGGSGNIAGVFSKPFYDTLNAAAYSAVPDGTGSAVSYSVTSVCPAGYYPGQADTISITDNVTISSQTCTPCPKYTTTYTAVATSAADCQCQEGFLDVRPYLDAAYTFDPFGSPCSALGYFCDDGTLDCVSYKYGAPYAIKAGYWKYSFNDWRLTVVGSKSAAIISSTPTARRRRRLLQASLATLVSDTSTLRAATGTLVLACPTGGLSGCGTNTTGSDPAACINGFAGVQCATCQADYFYTSTAGACLECATRTKELTQQIWYDIGLLVGVVAAVVLLWLLFLRPVSAVIALKADGDPAGAAAEGPLEDLDAEGLDEGDEADEEENSDGDGGEGKDGGAVALDGGYTHGPRPLRSDAESSAHKAKHAAKARGGPKHSAADSLAACLPMVSFAGGSPNDAKPSQWAPSEPKPLQQPPLGGAEAPAAQPASQPTPSLEGQGPENGAGDTAVSDSPDPSAPPAPAPRVWGSGSVAPIPVDAGGQNGGGAAAAQHDGGPARAAGGTPSSTSIKDSVSFTRLRSSAYPRTMRRAAGGAPARVRGLRPRREVAAADLELRLQQATTDEERQELRAGGLLTRQADRLYDSLRLLDLSLLKAALPRTFLPLPSIALLVAVLEEAGDKIKVVFSLFQVLVLLPTIYELSWPTNFLGFTNLFDFVALNFADALPIGCVSKHDWYNGLIIATSIPLGLAVLPWLALAAAWPLLRAPRRAGLLNRAISLSIFIMFIVYPGVSSKVLQFFNCQKLGEGFYALRYNHNTQCYTDAYWAHFPYSVAMLIVYPVAVPTLLAALLLLQHRRGGLLSATNRARYGLLTNAYRGAFFWWEIAELFRKLFLSAIAVFIYAGSATQIMVSCLILAAYACAVLLLRPYRVRSDAWIATLCHFELFFILMLAQMVRVGAFLTDHYSVTALAAVMVGSCVLLVAVALSTILGPAIAKRRMAVAAQRREAPDGKALVM